MPPAGFYQNKFGRLPSRILMLKGHSAGIGDLLRSSAAWRALRDAFPESELHLVLLTKDPGAASEGFIARHHLLRSFAAIDKRGQSMGAWTALLSKLDEIGARIRPDLIIDFEPAGLRSSIATRFLGLRQGTVTAGVAQFPGRGLFYRIASPSVAAFARRRGLTLPLEYTQRDFVALSALGIERNGTPIELEETDEARRFRSQLRNRLKLAPDLPLIGLNIGCGTPDARVKRPPLELLKQVVETLRQRRRAAVVLAGARFEQDVNKQFLELFAPAERTAYYDLAGQTTLLELCGLIRACSLFISTDSGPYHMSVALRTPTLAIFRGPNPAHYHCEPHVRCVVLGKEAHVSGVVQAGMELPAKSENA